MRPILVLHTVVIILTALAQAVPGSVMADRVLDFESFPDRPGLADYLERATTHNPELQTAHHRVEALRQEAKVAGSLPDLKFMWGEMIVPVETRVGPQQRVFSLSQNIPWFGTLGLKEKSTLAGADAAEARLQATALTLHRNIRDVWYQLALVQREEEILAEHLDLARQAELSIRKTYEAGKESFSNLIKAQMELGRVQTQLDNLRDRSGPLTAKLNNLAALDPYHQTPSADLNPPFIAEETLGNSATLHDILKNRNPALRAERNLLAAAHSKRELAGKEGSPDLTLGLDYIMTGDAINPDSMDSGKDPVIARLGFSIPLWGGRASAGKAASAEMVQAADYRLTSLRLDLETRLEEVLYRIRVASRNTQLYGETLYQRAVQDMEVTTAAYQSGQMDFEDLLGARQNLLGIELARLQAQTEHSRALNELITLLGGEAAASASSSSYTSEKVEY